MVCQSQPHVSGFTLFSLRLSIPNISHNNMNIDSLVVLQSRARDEQDAQEILENRENQKENTRENTRKYKKIQEKQ